jgi:hypothetical protein
MLVLTNNIILATSLFPSFNYINPLNAELNPICHLLAFLGAHHILHVSRTRVNTSRIFVKHLSETSTSQAQHGHQAGNSNNKKPLSTMTKTYPLAHFMKTDQGSMILCP